MGSCLSTEAPPGKVCLRAVTPASANGGAHVQNGTHNAPVETLSQPAPYFEPPETHVQQKQASPQVSLGKMPVIARIMELLGSFTTSQQSPALALTELAELLMSKAPEIDYCSIICITRTKGGSVAPRMVDVTVEGSTPGFSSGGCSDSGEDPTGVQLACWGEEAAVSATAPVVICRETGVMQAYHTNKRVHVPSIEADKAAGRPVPGDFEALAGQGGLAAFASLPIASGRVVHGVLTVASKKAGVLDSQLIVLLEAAATCLVQHLGNPQTVYLADMLAHAFAAPDFMDMAGLLVNGLAKFMRMVTNVDIQVRLGLLDTDGGSVLMIERAPHAAKDTAAFHGYLFEPPALECCAVAVSELPLANTLIASAVQHHKARCISDCAAYFQSCVRPARDVFTVSSQLVSALAVVPLSYGLCTFNKVSLSGGFYFTMAQPTEFRGIQEHILGAVSATTLIFREKLRGKVGAVRSNMADRHSEEEERDGQAASGSRATAEALGAGGGDNGTGGDAGSAKEGSDGEEAPPAANGVTASSLKTKAGKQMCTEALMKSVEHKLHLNHRVARVNSNIQAVSVMERLTLQELIGRGGYGTCYKATYKGAPAAVKIMYARQHERELMKDAVEMAVLSAVNHPHVVQLMECLTDMVEVGQAPAGGADASTPGDHRLPVYRPVRAKERGSVMTCNMIIMEFCDRGTLRDATKCGTFHSRLSSTTVGVDLMTIIRVLLQVASSMEHLHSRKLLHCDIKMENILLKSDPTREIGFVCKLADFGLAKMMNESDYATNRSGSGTITHLAPEMLTPGYKLTGAVDTYAFGILMYELYSGSRAYNGLNQQQMVDRVLKGGARPVFPATAPLPYAQLARSCWSVDPALRPTAGTISKTLEGMLGEWQAAKLRREEGRRAAAGTGGPGASPREGVEDTLVALS